MAWKMLREILRPVLVDVVVPVILLTCSVLFDYRSVFHWLSWLSGVGAFIMYTFIKGEWFFFGYASRFILLLGYVIVVVITFEPILASPFFVPLGVQEVVGMIFLFTFSALAIIALRGHRHSERDIDVSFPLQGGIYYIAQGGNSVIMNHHYPASYSKFAIDILMINEYGFRAHGLYPRDLHKYLVFDEVVYSPVEGTVVKAVDGVPDRAPPEQDLEQPAGNHVILKHFGSNELVFLAHLRRGSLLVCQGDTLCVGDPIARVGNSGLSTEPHLHIHCELDASEEYNILGEGIPLIFDGRFLRRNHLVRN
jgi:hypothetical protein